MHEIRERTVVKTAEGEKVLLPGRVTNAEAEEYGLVGSEAKDEKDDNPAKAAAKKSK